MSFRTGNMLYGTPSGTTTAEGDQAPGGTAEKQTSGREGRIVMNPINIALILLMFGTFQVISFTCFRLADFRGFSFDSLAPLLRDIYFWFGVLAAGASLVMSFTLVRISDTSISLVLLLYINGIIVSFLLLPLTWKYVFEERIFTSLDRILAFCLAVGSAGVLLFATYLWNRGG